jgi:hypothetical protein
MRLGLLSATLSAMKRVSAQSFSAKDCSATDRGYALSNSSILKIAVQSSESPMRYSFLEDTYDGCLVPFEQMVSRANSNYFLSAFEQKSQAMLLNLYVGSHWRI